MLASGVRQLREELNERDAAPAGFFCLSATPQIETGPPPQIPDLLERINGLQARGGNVLLFRERELYSMTDFVNRYTRENVRFVLGLSLLVRVWEYRYKKLPGGFLEGLSRPLAQNVRIYAYPMRSADLQQSIPSISATGWQWNDTNGWVSARQLRLAPPLGHIFDHVLATNFLIPMATPTALTR